ncbi:sugar phosphate nucleotidyltransferase [Flavobacteriaceae bacterium]|nr:sugar phosphate nucleotidyltransferase [Flavobacteriaceae bacterium]
MNKRTLVILAAGMGSRYGGLKQMDTMTPEGETIMDFSIYDAIQAGFNKVVFIIRESFKKEFKEVFESKWQGRIELEFVFQELENGVPSGTMNPERVKPWGTAHAILMCKDIVNENFVVINADDFYSRGAFVTIANHLDKMNPAVFDMTMVGYELKNTVSDNGYVSRGQCYLNQANELVNVIERTQIEKKGEGLVFKNDDGELEPISGDTLVSMNFWGFTPKIFEELEREFQEFLKNQGQELKSEFFIPSVVNKIIQEKRGAVEVLSSDAKWLGVTYAEDKPIVEAAITELKNNNTYPKLLWA